MSVIVDAFGIFFQPLPLLLLSIAVIAGIAAGAIPGFSAANAIAVALPFSLVMEPEVAFMFLAGIYVGAAYGGCLPAILINAPGTTGAAATTLDGYPMSQKGEAPQAIGVSIVGSAIAGFIAAIVLMFVMEPVGGIALQFGQPETFVLALFGIVCLALVLGDDIKKGIVSGAFGIVLAAITADPTTAQPRMTFGFPQLYDQIPFIPIIIGLFAISEVIYLVKKDKISESEFDMSYANVFEGGRWVLGKPVQLLRATSIGAGIGLIPGAGPAVANFISWYMAKAASKTPDAFGKGIPDGVLASEASENATAAGVLVPTLALGIPGTGSAAVMLGALLMHGIIPGPRLMSEFLTESVAILMGVAFANILVLVFGLTISKYLLKVVQIPTNILVPAVVLFTSIGAFAIRNNVFDIWFMMLFGILGFLMREKGFPIIPLVLGVILGPIAEPAFQRSMLLGRGSFMIFFESTISRVLWAGMVVFFAVTYLGKRYDLTGILNRLLN